MPFPGVNVSLTYDGNICADLYTKPTDRGGGGGGGGGGWGGCSPPKFWATQIFWVAKEISMFLFFEEIDIFYFNLKSAWYKDS